MATTPLTEAFKHMYLLISHWLHRRLGGLTKLCNDIEELPVPAETTHLHVTAARTQNLGLGGYFNIFVILLSF